MRRNVAALAAALSALVLAFLLSGQPASAAPELYWEAPARLSRGVGAYPQALRTAGRVVALWQENSPEGDGGQAWLSLASYGDESVERRDRFAGPFRYHGDAPVLFSAAADGNGVMAVAASSGEQTISVYLSRDGGRSFAAPAVLRSDEPGVSPRIFTKSGGGWLLFVTRVTKLAMDAANPTLTTDFLSIYYARSEDGVAWTEFLPFVSEASELRLNFLPSAASLNGTDVVVFQSRVAGSGDARASNQLFSMTTSDGGATWSQPRLVTDFLDPVRRDRTLVGDFDNQRPNLANIGGSLWMAWERAVLSGDAQIYAARLDASGAVAPGSVERVTLGAGACSEARLFDAAGQPGVVWFDDRRSGSRVYAAFREGALWSERDLSGRSGGKGSFGRALYLRGGLYAFWQSGEGSKSSVYGMVPDTSVRTPTLAAVDFEPSRPARRDRATVRWTAPEDSSGILGYSYVFSKDAKAEPPDSVMLLETSTRTSAEAAEDGSWYFAVRAQDYAGNWSRTSRLEFVRDTTPPGAPLPEAPAASADGFLASNTLTLSWAPPGDTDTAGYTWRLDYLGPLDRLPARRRPAATPSAAPAPFYDLSPATDYERSLWQAAAPAAPPAAVLARSPSVELRNLDDGYWAFTVAAIDGVGNVGDSTRLFLRADKFRPYTLVSDVMARRDDFGTIALSLVGRGFAEDGAVTRLAVDSDGREPYDRLFELGRGEYSVVSDRLLSGAQVSDLPVGSYRVGLFHPVRGWYFTDARLKVDLSGTVKFGDFGTRWKPSWTFAAPSSSLIDISTLYMIMALLLPALGVLLSLRQVAVVVNESRSARLDVRALLEGKPMPAKERERVAKEALRRGAGLTAKFTFTISLLVIFVVALVSLPLGYSMLRTQSQILAEGLEQRARVLLESAAQGGRSYLPAKNVMELSLITNQMGAMAEAQYMTITGYGTALAADPDVVWATNDRGIQDKTGGAAFSAGVSALTDLLSPRVPEISRAVNEKAIADVGAINEALQKIQAEGRTLATQLDAESQARLAQLGESARDLERTINERLTAIADASVSSEPAFDPAKLSGEPQEFLFYKPVLFRQGTEPVYYRGMVRLSVSTKLIVEEVRKARNSLVRSVLLVAALAFVVGIVGSFILSGIIINPIRKLVKGIETIRDEPDKRNLASFTIDVKTRDELAVLAATINDMTAGLVDAAKEAEFLTVGKEVQKMFLPLATNSLGEKLTTAYEDFPTHTFFGYYEGAKGVSGDYFDFRPLDGRFWAFIKCDVSGKGVPAALIMVGVATIFMTDFQDWTYEKKGIKLDKLVYKINDFLDKLKFKGRFAAFLMGVYDSKTGAVHLCHAGDNLVRVYEADRREVVTHKLDSAPTAGTFPNSLVEMTAPYKQVMIKLNPGDSLLLYTDGFDEAKRVCRDASFKDIYVTEKQTDREGKEVERKQLLSEQMGEPRLKEIIEAVASRGTYVLAKDNDPLGPDMRYEFDFSKLDAGPDDMVLGLAAVEKVFRLNPDPQATVDDKVFVDVKIDELLSKCWKDYARFCSDKHPHPDPQRTEYLYYGRMKEDEQYDDLTMMLIKRKD